MATIRVYWTIDTATPTAAKATAHAQGHNLTVLSSAEVGGAFLTLCDGIEGAETHIRVMDWQQKYKDGDRAKVTGTVRFVKDWQTQSGTKGRTIYLDNARLSAAKPLATPEAS